MDAFQIAVSLVAALFASAGILILMTLRTKQDYDPLSAESRTTFLFQDEILIDATPSAARMLNGNNTGWTDVLCHFRDRFSLPETVFHLSDQAYQTKFDAINRSDNATLEISQRGKFRKIILLENARDEQKTHALSVAVNDRPGPYEGAVDSTPVPIWQQSGEGVILWSNSAYHELCQKVTGAPPDPQKPLFQFKDAGLLPGKVKRLKLQLHDKEGELWFDIHRKKAENGDFFSALDADAIVRAEIAQRNFVQTLAKTFAQLPIGLAIFDENRQLVLFNPSLIDLTGLSAEFLSARPNLLTFFDELRDRRLMPEPKNYSSWRHQIADLVAAASDGRYSEVWSLPNARTYSVNGRPHPDGAIAFLIEDISAEISLTRSFRAELELGQSVLDNLETAIAVFSSTGLLTMTNAPYRQLWDVDPETSFADTTILDCSRDWQEKCAASPVLGELRDFVMDLGDRTAWSSEITLSSGQCLLVAAIPLISGSTMIRFTAASSAEPGLFETDLTAPIKA